MKTLSSPYLHARTDPRTTPRKPGKAHGTGCRTSHGAEWTNGRRWKDTIISANLSRRFLDLVQGLMATAVSLHLAPS
ncbi:hypothetical protein NEUTE1DRAFT_43753 [Neurospora tetrasperma FGSC 2508]|uniref:Uncharacterized protein n=1 Tax=Neurospora tetrasperma (strain FGSC 2508 / ATCC MYA-4615 / P0657) TaxID=510951 RepID=F8MNL3_NEUT8|nr:uncharacterized protein NEUTE1DRAFT_43753 [Neurospora tetrasperma FGSC 2508]EGO56981.1 hypothetical protein NEUTE1DRAFT_43753 [Neurospora tetrasperma FGSC 2508]EGZ70117.1 hypothetical protein NEUTE2DRAFT_69228 [Neurospora tetrasperma FGSC 2509]